MRLSLHLTWRSRTLANAALAAYSEWLDASDSELVITGEIDERERKGALRRRTRRTGRFEYRVTLPGDADTRNIDASLSDGVLTVRIPKPEHAKPRQVEIKS